MGYDLDLKKQWDEYSALEYARKEGWKQGWEIGWEIGMREAREKNLDVVKGMIHECFSDERIARGVKVSVDFVREIRASIETKGR